jgi:hypothetical protein
MTNKHETPQALADAVQELVDDTLVLHYDRASQERFTECRLCGGWEDHTDTCPIPAMVRWLSEGDEEETNG